MFRRSEKSQASADPVEPKGDGKGRPTPTRKEAEAAAKLRARAGMDKKAAQKLLRERRADQNKKMREGMKTGDERFLPARDQGPVKRYVRDWVDARLTFTEFLLPILILIMVLTAVGGTDSAATTLANTLWMASILMLVVDVVYTRVRLRKALRDKFGPDEELRGTTFYAFVRVLQIRPLRMPKPKVKVGQKID